MGSMSNGMSNGMSGGGMSNGMMNGMGMMNGNSNTPGLGMQSQPSMNTFNSNPMSLGPLNNSNGGNGGGMNRTSSNGGGSMHTPNNQQGLISSPTRNSYTSPSYGQQNSQSPYGHHPPYGSSNGNFNGMSNGTNYPPHDPMGILRPVGNRPQSPLNLSGIRGVGNAVGISTLLPNNGASGNGYSNGPSNMMLGGQSQPVVSANPMFPTPMPPHPPPSPGFHKSPHHQGLPANLGMPQFNPGLSDMSIISNLSSMPQGFVQMPNAMPSRKIITTAPQMQANAPVMVPPMNNGASQNGSSLVTINGAGKPANDIKRNEGITTPKSQASDVGDDK